MNAPGDAPQKYDADHRRQAEERIARQHAVLSGIARIFREALTCQTEEELGRVCLAVAEQVTQSKFGFIGEINVQTGQLDVIAISDPGWDVCRIQAPSGQGRRPLIGFDIRGIYGRVLLDSRGFFTNDPPSHPDSIGTPTGHPPLRAFLGVPLIHADKTIGMMGLGNRERGYGPEELEAAEALAPAIIQAFVSKRAEAKLRASENHYRELVQHANSAIIRWSRDGALTFFNEYAEAFFGYRADEVLGQHVGILVPERESTGADLTGLAQDIVDHPERYRNNINENICRDGRHVWMTWTNRAIRDERGQVTEILAIGSDVTEQKRAEEAMRESEQRMQMALEISRSFAFEWDPVTDRVLRSESCGCVLGLSGDEAQHDTGREFFQRLHPDDRGRFARMLDVLTPSANLYRTVYRVTRGDGTTVVLEEAARGFFDNEGRLRRLVGVATDITERTRAEARAHLLSEVTSQLLASDQPQRIVESLCRKVMEHLDCHAFFHYLVDEDAGRLHLNACAGIPEESVRHLEWLDYGVAVCGCVARDGRRIVVEQIQSRSDPRTALVRSYGIQAYACHPLLNQGRVIGTLAFGSRTRPTFAEDELVLMKTVADHVALAVQRVRLMESLEQHARAAEAASVAKSQFLANMSHELRTPMNAILGMIDVALPKAVDPTVLDCLETARGSADLLLTLLNDLLDSAKIESGKLELEVDPFSLRRMLDQLTRVLSVRASEKGLCFSCQIPGQTPDAVVGDRMRLQQVLLNLAGNAIKFTERGDVRIVLRCVLLDGEACLEFAVQDTGIGIPRSVQARLFQPFAQADVSMARRFGGTGLGLAISKSLVELMGGRIWLESELGRGSTFFVAVRLPLAKELVADFVPPPTVSPTLRASLRILLVEDNPANQKLATYILQDRGHRVEIAMDGQQAIDRTERDRYDVILMDVQMPGVNGLEATAAIRRREGTARRVPIIAMTAHAMKGDREHCLAAGMDGYLSKPVQAQEMIDLVERLAYDPATSAPVAATTSGPAETLPATTLVFDPEEALARCLHREELVREMVQCFFDEQGDLFPQIRTALENGDLEEVGRLGHRMKGTVVYLGAQAAKEAALRVERFCKSSGGTTAEAEEAIDELELACHALAAALRPHPWAAGLALAEKDLTN